MQVAYSIVQAPHEADFAGSSEFEGSTKLEASSEPGPTVSPTRRTKFRVGVLLTALSPGASNAATAITAEMTAGCITR